MRTLEQVRERIKRNFPDAAQSDAKRQKKVLEWNRETMNTMVTSCGTYRIGKMEDPENKGVYGYSLMLAPTPTAGPKHLCGPLLFPKDARDAAQRHSDGFPLQADLA